MRLVSLTLASLLLVHCEGVFTASTPEAQDPIFSGGDLPAPVTPGQPATPGVVVLKPMPAHLRVLTATEFQNSVGALLRLSPSAVPPLSPASLQNYGFSSVAAASTTLSEAEVELAYDTAEKVAAQVFGNTSARVALVGCEPRSFDDACVTAFFQRWFRHAFRGADTPELVSKYRALGTVIAASSVWQNIERVVVATLASPHFLFRSEMGSPIAQDTASLRYEGFELASRLSFAILQTTPSPELLEAAARGELSNVSGLLRHAKELLQAGGSRSSALSFFSENLRLEKLSSSTKDNSRWPEFTPSLRTAMRGEIERQVADFVATSRDLRELYSFDNTFVNTELAQLYKMPSVNDWRTQGHTESTRAGILGTAGFLSSQASNTETSPTHRGKFILENILCQTVLSVPLDVDNAIPPARMNTRQTLRQRLSAHVENPRCAGCHVEMDSLGFGLEGFDAIGKARTMEEGQPVDSSGSLAGQPFSTAKQLGEILAKSPQAVACLSQRVFRQVTAAGASEIDPMAFEGLGANLSAQTIDWNRLMLAVIASDGFRFATRTP
jgi:hypothetical protein